MIGLQDLASSSGPNACVFRAFDADLERQGDLSAGASGEFATYRGYRVNVSAVVEPAAATGAGPIPVGEQTGCIGGCSNLQIDYQSTASLNGTSMTIGVGCDGGTAPRVTSSAARGDQFGSCSLQAHEQSNAEQQHVNTLQTQMTDEQTKQQMDRWKILKDAESIFAVQPDLTQSEAKHQDKL